MHTTLFEHQAADPRHALEPAERARLETFLDGVWQGRALLEPDAGAAPGRQPFLTFDGGRFAARQFVGFFEFEGRTIEILPKLFEGSPLPRPAMLRHLLYWLGHCRRLHLPHSAAALDELTADTLPELIRYWFARLAHDRVMRQPFVAFEEKREVLGAPRGQVQFGAYATQELPRGQFHRFDCVHAPLSADNMVNRALRQAAALLLDDTASGETRQLLQEVLRRLEYAADGPAVRPPDLERLQLPAFYAGEYDELLTWCIRILRGQHQGPHRGRHSQWTLLLPMAYVFEEFVAGFLERCFHRTFEVARQPAGAHLATEAASGKNSFPLRPDLLLTDRATGRKIVLDTKYKLRRVRGIEPGDMYQLVAYALRYEAEAAVLVYPGTPTDATMTLYRVPMPNGTTLRVWTLDVPVWSAAGVRQTEDALQVYFQDFFEQHLPNNAQGKVT